MTKKHSVLKNSRRLRGAGAGPWKEERSRADALTLTLEPRDTTCLFFENMSPALITERMSRTMHDEKTLIFQKQSSLAWHWRLGRKSALALTLEPRDTTCPFFENMSPALMTERMS